MDTTMVDLRDETARLFALRMPGVEHVYLTH